MIAKGKVDTLLRSRSKKMEALRFVITGGIATAIQYVLYVLFVQYSVLSAEISAVISYLLSFIVNFFLSNFFTFRTNPNTMKAVSFAVSHGINLGLQTLFVWLFKDIVGKTYALLPAMAICIPINFFLVRFALTAKYFQKSKIPESDSISF